MLVASGAGADRCDDGCGVMDDRCGMREVCNPAGMVSGLPGGIHGCVWRIYIRPLKNRTNKMMMIIGSIVRPPVCVDWNYFFSLLKTVLMKVSFNDPPV